MLGTPAYMSPEQAAGQREAISAASDIYSLGAVLHTLLTGRPPPRPAADDSAEFAAPPRLPRSETPDPTEDALETICLRCLQFDPQRGYPRPDPRSRRNLAFDGITCDLVGYGEFGRRTSLDCFGRAFQARPGKRPLPVDSHHATRGPWRHHGRGGNGDRASIRRRRSVSNHPCPGPGGSRRHGDLRNSSPPAVTMSRVLPKTYPIDSISGQAIAQFLTDA